MGVEIEDTTRAKWKYYKSNTFEANKKMHSARDRRQYEIWVRAIDFMERIAERMYGISEFGASDQNQLWIFLLLLLPQAIIYSRLNAIISVIISVQFHFSFSWQSHEIILYFKKVRSEPNSLSQLKDFFLHIYSCGFTVRARAPSKSDQSAESTIEKTKAISQARPQAHKRPFYVSTIQKNIIE